MLGRCRTPHGVRGLKFRIEASHRLQCLLSHPSRGAWIEITGLRSLMSSRTSRTPHGVRGLKLFRTQVTRKTTPSHPSRGAWIEIMRLVKSCLERVSRTPHGVRGLK